MIDILSVFLSPDSEERGVVDIVAITFHSLVTT